MRIKIVSDGSQWGSKVLNAETGENLGLRCRKIEWEHTAKGLPVATLTCLLTDVELEVLDPKITAVLLVKETITHGELARRQRNGEDQL